MKMVVEEGSVVGRGDGKGDTERGPIEGSYISLQREIK